MKLPFKRSRSKKAKAADVLGSVASLWSDLQLSKRASKGVEASRKKAAAATSAVGSGARMTPTKLVAALALLGAMGALAARKLKGDPAEPLPYVPPASPPSNAGATAGPVAAAASGPLPPEPAIVVEQTPIVLEDLAGQTGDADQSGGEKSTSDAPDADEPGAGPEAEAPSPGKASDKPAGDDN